MGMEAKSPEENFQFSSSQTIVGLRLTDKANSRVLLVQEKGFTYSHLPPYTSWEVLRREAYEAWKIFIRLCKPQAVIRCALRYINRIDAPKSSIELRDYFQLCPSRTVISNALAIFSRLPNPTLRRMRSILLM